MCKPTAFTSLNDTLKLRQSMKKGYEEGAWGHPAKFIRWARKRATYGYFFGVQLMNFFNELYYVKPNAFGFLPK